MRLYYARLVLIWHELKKVFEDHNDVFTSVFDKASGVFGELGPDHSIRYLVMELHDNVKSASRRNTSPVASQSLIRAAFKIRIESSLRECHNEIIGDVRLSARLASMIRRLSAPVEASHLFLRVATSFKASSTFRVHANTFTDAASNLLNCGPLVTPISLPDILQLLGLPHNDTSIRTHIREDMTMYKTSREYSALQQQDISVHSTIRLHAYVFQFESFKPSRYIGSNTAPSLRINFHSLTRFSPTQ
ncbi:hypothetical protein BCR34DRAFT_554643 [Clohesyomyces aquaticus]|uniref:Uncharacterized protein n=1 Tax=Clohesyomyces aquaticus TaxID=1231657 RepID=A0A1Y2A6R3_9PLEO|nr:hypothetical protein BCR34DRAFT_554643 [Clohesyomyces aquaticus]